MVRLFKKYKSLISLVVLYWSLEIGNLSIVCGLKQERTVHMSRQSSDITFFLLAQ